VGALAIVGVTISIGLSLLLYRFTVDLPEWRIPGIAALLFAGMFFSRVFAIGPLAFILGFVLSATQSVAELAPSSELLVQALLWLWVVVSYPLALTVVVGRFLLPVEATAAAAHSSKKKSLFASDTFTNPTYVRFALKVTLAAMSCYIVYTAVDWAGIHTAFITCCFIALEDAKATLYKGMLRIVGCLIGALLGFLAILYLVPHMESIASLSLLIGAVSFGAAWIATGSERISYAGLQIAFAFFMCLLQGFGPGTDFDTIRDRIVGILFGISMMTLVFCLLWPESPEDQLPPALAGVFRKPVH
jgi:multidrug resistance protein MdtO